MKIEKITLSNLTSFEGTHTIDFTVEPLRSASLFAIAGDTGAGKSTLLDAICLALYNRAPRLDNADRLSTEQRRQDEGAPEKLALNDPRGLMRRGTKECFVAVEFSMPDGCKWEARWSCTMKRTGNYHKPERQLRQLSPRKQTIEADKRDLQREINRIVGLDYEQFTRTVMLAQNSFATFLKAKKDDKSALLEKLTGTELYARISMEIYRRHQEANQEASRIEDHIAGLLHDQLSPDELNDLESRLQKCYGRRKYLEEQRAVLQRRRDYLHRYDELRQATEKAEEARVGAAREVARRAADRERLERYDSIQPVRGIYASLLDLKAQLESADTRRQTLEKEKTVLDQQLHAAEEQRDVQVARLHDATKENQERQGDLNEGRKIEGEIASENATLKQALSRQKQAEEEAALMDSRLKAAQEKQQQLRDQQTQLQLRLQQLSVHRTMFDNYDLLREKLNNFRKENQRHEEEQKKLMTAQAEVARIKLELQERNDQLNKAQARQSALLQNIRILREEAAHEDLQNVEDRLIETRDRQTRLRQAATQWQRLCDQYELRENIHQSMLRNQAEADRIGRELTTAEALLEAHRANFEQRQREYLLSNNKDIIELRQTLREGMPCPVCGGTHHPYHTETERELGQLADTLRDSFMQARETYEHQQATVRELQLQQAELKTLVATEHDRLADATEQVKKSTEEWAQFATLDASLADASPTQNRHLRLVLLNQFIENTEKELHSLTDAYNRLQQNRQHTIQLSGEIDTLRGNIDEISQQKASLELALGMQQKNADDADRQSRLSNTSLEQLYQDISQLISLSDWLSDWQKHPDQLIEKISNAYSEWNATLHRVEQCNHSIEQINDTIRNAENLCETSHQRHQQTAEESEGIRLSIARKEERLRQLFGLSTPHDEQQRLSQRMQEANKALEEARNLYNEIHTRLTSHASIIGTLFETRQQLQQTIAEQNAKIDQWLLVYNMDHSPMHLHELDQLFNTDNNWAELRATLNALQTQLEICDNTLAQSRRLFLEHQNSPDRPDMDKSESERTVQIEIEDVEREQNTLQQEIFAAELRRSKHLSGQEKAAEKTKELEHARMNALEWSRLDQLAGSADGKKFRQIAQSHTFAYLVAAANQQLRSLSPRYRLRQLPGTLTIEVVDREMMDTARYVTSLSGGETFVVSLALALALAGLSAHGLAIGSLFIDEGFGNLDAESLELVMQALSNLENSQGRKVGVVSHMQQIREQIFPQINIRKMAVGGKSVVEIC